MVRQRAGRSERPSRVMRIGIDACRLHGAMSGIGRYLHGLLAPLNGCMPDAEFVLYSNAPLSIALPSARWSVRLDDSAMSRRLPSVLWTRYRLAALAGRDRLDVFWAANTLVPRGLTGLPVVTTVYDLNHLIVPRSMPLVNRSAHRLWLADDVRSAEKAVAISCGTSTRMLERLGRAADAIAPPGTPLADISMALADAESRLAAMKVRRPYVLAVGTREPRKNLASAMQAMARLRQEGAFADHLLVLAGSPGWGRDAAGGGTPDGVVPLGYVDDDQLAALYACAEVFVFPSLYEGFGIPVLEALQFGCRVVASDLAELREAGGPDIVYVRPEPAAIADGIRSALSKPRPMPRPPRFDWRHSARIMGDVLRLAAERGPTS